MDIPLVIEDSDSEDHAPKKKGASVATVTVTALEHPPEKNKPRHRKQLKSHQEQAATTGSDQEEEESDGGTALRKVQAQEEQKMLHSTQRSIQEMETHLYEGVELV